MKIIDYFKSKLGATSKHLLPTFFVYAFISIAILVLRVLIARLYGQEQLGVFTYFYNLVSFVFIFSSFGAADALTKVLAEDTSKLNQGLKHSFWIMLPATIISILVVYILTNFTSLNPDVPGINLAVVLYILIYSFFFLVYSIFRGFKSFVFGSSLSLIYRGLLILCILVMFLYKVEFIYFLYFMSVILVIPVIVAIPRLVKIWPKVSLKLPRKPFFYMALSLLLVQISFYTLRFVDSLVIKYVTDFASLGLYSAYSSITNVIRLTAYVFPVVMIPLAVQTRYKLRASLKKLLFFLAPFALAVLVAAYVLVPILYGAEYKSTFLPIALVVASSLLIVYSYLNSIFAGENVFSRFYLTIIIIDVGLSLVVSILLSILLVRVLGIVGAPIAITIVLLFKILLNVYAIKKLRYKR
ncbi:lipopolysaccharide biosynthesis protein [Candidatus Woesearchaeota archaeon]|nr:lipopolysaccharide biosynthesis protein [Candidatus Woesearchaeota archaeon]